MKKIAALILVLTTTFSLVHAQDEEKKKGFDKSKLFVGGNFGMTFGDYTLINVSPQLGYRFNQYFATGAGFNFQYASLKQRDFNGNPVYKTSQDVIGLNIFGRVYPFRQFMIQAQPELNYVFGKQKYYGPPSQTTKLDASIIPSLLVGGGAVFPGGRGAFIASIFYDVLQRPNSPYSNQPIYNFGYNFGF
ncbi:MAG TPA: hypothetical protein VET23_07865 [Chitinophagaceae bacterium]|nr:hypothetical protein [Chitinophagaceae bacterium]